METLDKEGDKYIFKDGDVYVIDNDSDLYIWIGKDSSVDEKGAGAWVANKIDNQERGGEPNVYTVLQGEESDEFKSLLNFEVIDDDTPGFLKSAELDMVEYKLFRIFTKEETFAFDEAFIEEVPLDKSSLKSEDVFVLDGNENVYLWVGNQANREERMEGQKVLQKIDAERSYLPLQYTIYEDEGGKTEKAFYEFLEKAKDSGPVVSVEDQRELEYRPEEYQTAEEAKAEDDKEFADADPNDPRAREVVKTVDSVPQSERDTFNMSEEEKPDLTPAPVAERDTKPEETPVAPVEETPAVDTAAEEAAKAAEAEAAKKAEEERLAKEAEEKAKAEAEAKAKAEEEARLKAEAEAKAKAEEEARLKAEAEAKAKAEEEARLKAEAEAKAKAEEEARLKAEAEAKAKAEEEARLKAEAEAKAKAEEEARLKAEAEAKAKAEAEAKAKAEEEARLKAEAEAKAKAGPVKGVVKLFFIDGEFVENPKDSSSAKAIVEVSVPGQKVSLTFGSDAGLIVRRTASRQAESIAKSGFLLKSNERIGIGYDYEVIETDSALTEAHTRVGHSYNQ
ncbi:MAG: hypothetical protein INQ03_20510 [Candidatus Heimdallarchaeota archaeon]|nr:hypothetical protein [Candidatus Heimdallarchaeota archaeon]